MAEFDAGKINLDLSGFKAELTEAVRPIRLSSIALEAIEEVARARKKHGSNADLAYGVGPASDGVSSHLGFGVGSVHRSGATNGQLERYIKAHNDYGMSHGRTHTRAGVLLEEVIEAIATRNDDDLRTELIQVIAMGLDWVADIDAESAADRVDS